MREIKFRGWDEKNKEMVYHINLLFSNYLNECFEEYEECGLKIMQYTGLKDKNGEEIYEGDIVECYAGEHYQGCWEYQNRVVVEYCWTQSMWEMLNCDQLEVVGNIYENPERIPEVRHA